MSARMRTGMRTASRQRNVVTAVVNPQPDAGTRHPGGLPPSVSQVLASAGQPLDPATRAFMEPRFRHDFSRVRVHTDEQAAESARSVNALAYTVGRDVVFEGGQYAPRTEQGKRLLAHELAHVVQQSRGGQTPQVDPNTAHERHAALVAGAVMRGRAPDHGWVYTGVGLARQPKDTSEPEIEEIFEGKGTGDNIAYLVPDKTVNSRKMLAKGTRVEILEHKGEWAHVRVMDGENKDGTGLVRERFLKTIPKTAETTPDAAPVVKGEAPKDVPASTPDEPKKVDWVGRLKERVPKKERWESGVDGSKHAALSKVAAFIDLLLLAKSYRFKDPADPETAKQILQGLKSGFVQNYVDSIKFEKLIRGRNGISQTDLELKFNLVSGGFDHLYKGTVKEDYLSEAGWDRDIQDIEKGSEALYILTGEDYGSQSPVDKLIKAKNYAIELYLKDDVKKQVDALLSPQSLALMAGFAAIYIAAQVTPAGWVADALALTVITITAVFVGKQLFSIFKHLLGYLAAINATSEDELKDAGHELSEAIAEAGLAVFIALLSHAIKGSVPGELPYDPPPPGFADAVTDTGIPIRVPVQEAPASVPASVPVDLASKAVAVQPYGPSGSGSSSAPPSTKGPEVFDEISKDLGLEKSGDQSPSGTKEEIAKGSVEKAEAGGLTKGGKPGLVDLATQPHSAAPDVRKAQGVTGGTHQSAHIGPTSALEDVPGYSRRNAETVILPKEVHAAFDQTWKDWAISQRKAGRTQVTVAELETVMQEAIDKTPSLSQRTKNALAWRLQLELYRDLGLKPTDTIELPYSNVKPQP